MKIVIAIDSLKGCLTSAEAGAAAAVGVRRRWPDAEVICLPVSDGGEGWVEAFRQGLGHEAEVVEATVSDPLLRPVRARYLKAGDMAVVEVAEACGLHLLKPEERNPLRASSLGVGELLADAVRRRCRQFVVGLGGSGVSDAGRGMIQATALRDPLPAPPLGGEPRFARGAGALGANGRQLSFTIATDVANPLYGPNGAAAVFGPQKGATPDMVAELDRRARAFAESNARQMGFDCSQEPGAGAAGGLGYAFMQFFGAQRRSGAELLLELLRFDSLVRDADLVVTGEGCADHQTLMGKLPSVILRHACRAGVPCHLLAGRIESESEAALRASGFASVDGITPPDMPLCEAVLPDVARRNLAAAAEQLVAARGTIGNISANNGTF